MTTFRAVIGSSGGLWRRNTLITDAKDEDAQAFYQHYGFQLLPTERHDRHLFLPMGTVEQLFAG